MKNDPEFGSERRKRTTPELARKARGSGIYALLFWLIVGLVVTGVGLHGIPAGEVYESKRGFPMPAWELAGFGLAMVAACGWGLILKLRRAKS